MVDCGGQGSFINDKLSQSCQLPRLPKQPPVSLVLADGSLSQAGYITHYNPIVLRTAGNEELLGLDITPTSHDIILGMPWLKKHDPAVRFGSNYLTLDSPFCQKNSLSIKAFLASNSEVARVGFFCTSHAMYLVSFSTASEPETTDEL
jgi:hypothetical protein